LGEVIFQIVKTDFDVEFTTTSNDVFTGFLEDTEDQWVGLGELLETFDELWQITCVLWLDSDSDDW
jgi:hypothetical protein